MQKNDKILIVKDLVKSFPLKAGGFSESSDKIHALNSVSFSLDRNTTLGVVGESGCGKTTLAKTILRIHEPDNGTLFFGIQDKQIEMLNYLESEKEAGAQAEGKRLRKSIDFFSYPRKQLKKERIKMQYIFQDPYMSLNPKMEIKDIITEPLVQNRIIKKSEIEKKAAELLDIVGIPSGINGVSSSLSKYPHEFSGGQRQRISIARSISTNPKLVICDEPVSSLDVSIQSQILNLLIDIQREFNITYLFIAHNLSVVFYMSDSVAVMYTGRIVEYGKSREIYKNPRHPYTQLLMSVVPEIGKGKMVFKQSIDGEVPGLIHMPSGCSFYPRCRFRMDICRYENPPLEISGNDNHTCACHYVKKVQSPSSS